MRARSPTRWRRRIVITLLALLAGLLAAIPAQAGGPGAISVSKTTLAPSWTRSFDWAIDKSAPASIDMLVSDRGDVPYAIRATATGTDTFAFVAQLTIDNTGPETVTITSAVDRFVDDHGTVYETGFDCNASSPGTGLPIDIPPDESLSTCSTTVFPTSATSGSNVGVVACSGCGISPVTSASVPISFPSAPARRSNLAAITDTSPGFDFDGTLTATQRGTTDFPAIKYVETLDCTQPGTVQHENTATLVTTGVGPKIVRSAAAAVALTCDALEVSSSADSAFTRTYEWQIEKFATHEQIVLARKVDPDAPKNDPALSRFARSVNVRYAVRAEATPVDGDFEVIGHIDVRNPSPSRAAHIASVAGALQNPSQAADISGCRLVGEEAGGSSADGGHLVPPGETLRCDYAGAPDGTSTRHVAAVDRQVFHYPITGGPQLLGTRPNMASLAVGWGPPSKLVNATARVYDSRLGILGWAWAPGPAWFSYTLHLEPGSYGLPLCREGFAHNAATVVGNDTDTAVATDVNIPVNVLCFTHVGSDPKDDGGATGGDLPKLDPDDADTSTDAKGRIDGVKNDEFPASKIVCKPAKRYKGKRGGKGDPAWRLIGPQGRRTPFLATATKPTYWKVVRRPARGRQARLARLLVIAKLYALSGAPVDARTSRAFVRAERFFESKANRSSRGITKARAKRQHKLIVRHTGFFKRFIRVSKRHHRGVCGPVAP